MTVDEAKKWHALLAVLEQSPCPKLEEDLPDLSLDDDGTIPLFEPDWVSVTLCVICSNFSKSNITDSSIDLLELVCHYLDPALQGKYAPLIHGDALELPIEERLLKWIRKVTRLSEVQLAKKFLCGNSKASLEFLKRKYKTQWSDRPEEVVPEKVDNTINLKVSLDKGDSNA